MAAFEPYVGSDPRTSEVTFNFFHPTDDSWSTMEDTNHIVCYVISRDGSPLTGSAKGLGR